MLTTRELQDEIIHLKKEKDICILAHAYQSHDIWEVADYVGDSYGLSVQAAKAAQSTVLMCGVRFMAETVKILSPQKRVLLSNSNAGCPMAEQMDVELISGVKKMYPDYTVVAYINTTSELKTICDVCVTSSSAVQIVKNIENKNILFIRTAIWENGWLIRCRRKISNCCRGMSNACPHVETGCGKSTKGTSGRTSSGTSGMSAGGFRTGGLSGKYNRNHGLCKEK